MEKLFPFIRWFKNYNKEIFTKDLIAGLTVAVVLVPQSMAYALIAGLEPVYGLYAAAIPPIVGALWGSSPYLGTGPVAITAFLTFSAIITIAKPDDPMFLNLAITLAFLAGIIRIVMGVFKLGFLLSFVSSSVVFGFSNAAAIIISSTQVPALLGIKVEQKEFVFENFYEILKNVIHTHPYTLAVGLGSIAIIVGLRKIHSSIPSALVAVIVFTLLSYWLDFESMGIKVVGNIPSGLPMPSISIVKDAGLLIDLTGKALVIAIIGVVEAYSVSKIIASQTKQRLDVNQELIGQGLANIASGLFGAFPVSGSFSRTMLNYKAGAVTGVSSIVAGVFVILTLFFVAPLLYYLPRATLAALVIVAVIGIVKPRYFKELWKTNRYDGIAAIATLTFAFISKPDYAIFLGIFLSLSLFLWRSLHPRIVSMSRDPKTRTFVNVQSFNIPECPQISMVRPEASLYYANAENVVDEFKELIEQKPALKHFVIDGESINYVDATAVEVLGDFIEESKKKGVNIFFVNLKGPVFDTFSRSGLLDKLGKDKILPSKGSALSKLFATIDHIYCKEQCPYAVFDECYTVKEYIKFMPVEDGFVYRLFEKLHLDDCEILYGKRDKKIRIQCQTVSLELGQSDFAKDERGRFYLLPSGVAQTGEEFVTFGLLAKYAGLQSVNGNILLGESMEEVVDSLSKIVKAVK